MQVHALCIRIVDYLIHRKLSPGVEAVTGEVNINVRIPFSSNCLKLKLNQSKGDALSVDLIKDMTA